MTVFAEYRYGDAELVPDGLGITIPPQLLAALQVQIRTRTERQLSRIFEAKKQSII
jgi:hypothetical protein